MKKMTAAVLALILIFGVVSAMALSRNFGAIEITELMASNGDTLDDSFGKSADWIELHNKSDEDIDMEGLCLSDGKKNLKKFVFPEGIVLPANGYMVIFASGEESVATLADGSTEIHVAFKLSADGEKVVISFQDVILDMVKFDKQDKDISYAKQANGAWATCDEPTPGAPNY